MCAIFSNENHPIYSIFGHLPNTICFGMLYTCLEGMHSRIRRCFLAWSGACKWYLTPFHPSCRVKRTGHDNQFIWWVFMWEQKKNEFSPFFSFFHPNTRWWGVLHDRCRFILPLKTCELNRFYDDHVHISLDSIHLFQSRVFVKAMMARFDCIDDRKLRIQITWKVPSWLHRIYSTEEHWGLKTKRGGGLSRALPI